MNRTIQRGRLAARDKWTRIRVVWAKNRRPDDHAEAFQRLRLEAGRAVLGARPLNCIVFSKDRAMQLEACVRSIDRYAPYEGPIHVIYKASSEPYAQAYRSLGANSRTRLIPESDNFRSDTLEAIDPDVEYTVFHTDDDVFFRAPPAEPVLPEGFAGFSLRLGNNTTYCYPLNRAQRVPETLDVEPFIAWDWTRADGDFSYPLSLDGHVLRTDLVLRILERCRFSNPNELERELNFRRHLLPLLMLGFRDSCVVSIPMNIVSETHRNRSGQIAEYTVDALNARYLSGERIDLERMDFSRVRAAHEEIPVVFASDHDTRHGTPGATSA